MRADEIAELVGEVPGTEPSYGPGLVTVHIPAIGDTAQLALRDVIEVYEVSVPTGAPAVQFDLKQKRAVLPLIITVDDAVFTPVYADDVLVPDDELIVPAMPSLIAYSEMHRDVRMLGRAIDDPDVELDPEILAATLLAHRCFIAGAVRVGLWPVRVAAWWEYTSAKAVKAGVRLARFRADERWDRLMADVTEARRQSAPAEI
ncbi:hypothetical protein AB0M02_26260 [Actinoplanes sp. NPDC051861]|uniref:hypothetical protein n=1 Tax=Actinoplanes sp. NPDC051861 TaxID=3155170 RepID=UPI003414B286